MFKYFIAFFLIFSLSLAIGCGKKDEEVKKEEFDSIESKLDEVKELQKNTNSVKQDLQEEIKKLNKEKALLIAEKARLEAENKKLEADIVQLQVDNGLYDEVVDKELKTETETISQ